MKKIISCILMVVLMAVSMKSVFASEVGVKINKNEIEVSATEITVEAKFDEINSNISIEIPDERAPKSESNITNSDDQYVKVTLKANYYYDAITNKFLWSNINKVMVSTKSGYSYEEPVYSASLIDLNQTYAIKLTGKLVNTKDGTDKDYTINVGFHLNAQTGKITTVLW